MDSFGTNARFTSSNNEDQIFDENTDYWLPVDLYIEELSVQFYISCTLDFSKALRDIGLVEGDNL